MTAPIIGECDVCARGLHWLRKVIAYGIETYACGECLGDKPDDDDDDELDEPACPSARVSAPIQEFAKTTV